MSNAFSVLRFDDITVKPNSNDAVAAALKSNLQKPVGIWHPMIGVSANVVTVATNWRGEPEKADYKDANIVSVRSRLFDVLARGQEPCTNAGIYTHRWFITKPEHVDLLTQISTAAWETSEADTGMRIAGFWRGRELNEHGHAVVLMIVNYPSLAEWDATRYWKPKPQDVAQPNRDQWGGLFAKRREILTDSWVTVHRLA
jgi:hypothetical protein